MALVTRSANASIDGTQAEQVLAGNIYAGEDLDTVAPCYVGSDGLVYMSNGTAANAAAGFIGFTAKSYKSGEAVTLFGAGNRFRYGSSLTPGARLFVGATKGRLDAAATTGDTLGTVVCVTTTDILVTRHNPTAQ